MELRKEAIKINEIIGTKYVQTSADGDIIVPDINPDVLKVLRVEARPFIKEKRLTDGRVDLFGTVKITVLYIPETDDIGGIKSINSELNFECFSPLEKAKEDMMTSVDIECEKISHFLINSRKLSLKCQLGINIKTFVKKDLNLLTSKDAPDNLYVKESEIKFLNTLSDFEKDFFIREKIVLTDGMPEIEEILKVSVFPKTEDLKLAEDKAVLRGDAKISILYKSQKGSLECMEYTYIFTETFDVPDVKDTMTAEVEYIIKDINCSVMASDMRPCSLIDTEIIMGIVFKFSESALISVIEDAFCIDKETELKSKSYDIEKLLLSSSLQITQKEILELPASFPEILKVCELSCCPRVVDIQVENSVAKVKGIINVNLLYLSDDENCPASGFEQSFEFLKDIPLSSCTDCSSIEAKVQKEHISWTILGGRSLELRFINVLSLKCISLQKISVVDEIEIISDKEDDESSAYIYFVQKGDSLWNIAKHFKTPVEKIIEDNNLDGEKLITGQKIIVFK